MKKDQLRDMLQLARTAALEAGKIIESYNPCDLEVLSKEGMDSPAAEVLTRADLESQNRILEILNPSLNTYDFALLSEESTDDGSRFTKDYFWCIDPLDGTLPFTENRKGYSVSIALISREGIAEMGVVFDPRQNIMYTATRGGGAFLNGAPLYTSDFNASYTELNWIQDRSLSKNPSYDKWREYLSRETKLEIHSIIGAGAALNACWCIEEKPSVYFKPPRKKDSGGSLWDYGASSCIVQEAGGLVSDFYGNPLDLNRKGSTFMNHRGFFITGSKQLKKLLLPGLVLMWENNSAPSVDNSPYS